MEFKIRQKIYTYNKKSTGIIVSFTLILLDIILNLYPGFYLPRLVPFDVQSLSNNKLSLSVDGFLSRPLNRSSPDTRFFSKKLLSNGLKLSFFDRSFRFNRLWERSKKIQINICKTHSVSQANKFFQLIV